ncbi:MAG: ABC transporter permease, partial [Clostridiales bacterium]|nr:ABC transporter permease [Clostridiales bacterium]
MWRFILKRLLSLIPVIAGVIFVVFIILHMAPGDPARLALGDEAEPQAYIDWREERGLNDPVLIQYFRYMFKIVQGDFGTSYGRTQTPVFGEIMAKFPYTLALALCAMVITLLFAFPLGVLAAVKHNSWFDNISMFFSLIGVSMPTFWLGMLLILYFALGKGWFPTTGAGSWNAVILPAVSIGFGAMAGMARTTRSSMLE